jgi:2-isopropylmalate synthase
MSPEEVLEQAKRSIRFARNLADDIEFSAEDGYRSEMDFLCRVVEATIKEGASTINIPDTVGYATPELYGEFIKTLRTRVPNSDKAVWSVHCHNDLGMAVANSLAGVNGLGERAGNTALEEIVMALRTRKDYFDLICNIDAAQIVPASKMVSHITGFVVQPNKAVVGANAFAHTSGIHQDGILKNRETYEIMRAEDVGWTANKIVLGKLSGRNAFKQRLHDLGIVVEAEADVNEAFTRFKALADQKAEIFDEDIIAIMSDTASTEQGEHYKFISMSQHSETGERPKSRITLRIGDKEVSSEAEGNGPVDASLNAIEEVAKSGAEQLLYSVNAITSGTQSQGEVTVRLAKGGRIVNGVGTDPDIIAASAKAYLAALNKLHDPSQAKMNAQMTP